MTYAWITGRDTGLRADVRVCVQVHVCVHECVYVIIVITVYIVVAVVGVVVIYPKYICSMDPLRGIDCRFAVRPTHLEEGDSRRMAITR